MANYLAVMMIAIIAQKTTADAVACKAMLI